MKKMGRFSLVFALLLSCFNSFAQSIAVVQRPNPPKLVNNLSKEVPGFLSSQEVALLENKLDTFASNTSNQIAIVIVDDLGGYDAASYATALGHSWGVGQNKFDNGIVILIKPTGGEGQRDAYIAIGYGLEGAIPDIAANHVLEQDLIPAMANGNNFVALDRATTTLMKLARGEINSKEYVKEPSWRKHKRWIIPLAIVLLIFFFSTNGGGGGTINRGGWRGGWGFGGFGGFGGGGGGWSGGGGGGGFGGFGGGGFGGGGAGGKW